jgi:hypothetical protein
MLLRFSIGALGKLANQTRKSRIRSTMAFVVFHSSQPSRPGAGFQNS